MMHLPPLHLPLFILFLVQDEMDLNERPGSATAISVKTFPVDVRPHRIDRSLFLLESLSLSPSFVSAPNRKREWRNRGGFSRIEKPRRLVSNDRSFPRADLNGRAHWKKT